MVEVGIARLTETLSRMTRGLEVSSETVFESLPVDSRDCSVVCCCQLHQPMSLTHPWVDTIFPDCRGLSVSLTQPANKLDVQH